MNENDRMAAGGGATGRMVSLGLAVALSVASPGCEGDSTFVCERLAGCGCLTESVDTCAERLDEEDGAAVELCAECLSAHDYLCHELGANHAVCGGCTDDFASPDRARQTDPDQPPYDDSNYPEVVDKQALCLELD